MRKRREALGISQGRLGRHLGLTFSQIQKYEKGTNRIGAGRLYQIATYLGVTPSHFFEGSMAGPSPSPGRGRTAARIATSSCALSEAFAAIDRRPDQGVGPRAGPLARHGAAAGQLTDAAVPGARKLDD